MARGWMSFAFLFSLAWLRHAVAADDVYIRHLNFDEINGFVEATPLALVVLCAGGSPNAECDEIEAHLRAGT
jgi:hypothetical protein